MNRTRMLVLASVSLVLSLLVTQVAYRLLKQSFSTSATTEVVVAATKLQLGARIKEADVRKVPWPAAIVPQGSFADPKEIVGRGVVVPMVPDEPILESKISPTDGGSGLTWAIPDGLRAVAVRVDEVVSVAGFVLPGTRVDVILTGSLTRNRGTDTSRVIIENVQVLSAGSDLEQDAEGTPQDVAVVTLLVTPEDAQKLALAAVDGRIQLALRNPLDLEKREPAAVQKSALYLGSAPSPEPSLAPPRKTVNRTARPLSVHIELIQGDKRETLTFVKGRQ